eukprot:858535-Pleurochrysis_carterae.AAC.1
MLMRSCCVESASSASPCHNCTNKAGSRRESIANCSPRPPPSRPAPECSNADAPTATSNQE